jgi:hypothetical protein
MQWFNSSCELLQERCKSVAVGINKGKAMLKDTIYDSKYAKMIENAPLCQKSTLEFSICITVPTNYFI